MLLEDLDEPLKTENLGVGGLDLQYNRPGRERNGCGRRKSCKASQQHRANHKGKREEDRRSERIGGKKKTYPYEKRSRKCEAYRFNLYLTRTGMGGRKN